MKDSDFEVASCREWAGQAAGDFVLLDPGDLPAMAHFVKRLESRAAEWDAPDTDAMLVEARDLLREAAGHIKDVIVGRAPDPVAAMRAAGNFLGSIQTRLRAGTASPGAETRATPPDNGGESFSMIDETIINAYVEQQLSVLPDMENLILTYERERDETLLSDLRRMIHTLKGESGVVGALAIERVAHQLEDYLAEPSGGMASDVLLAVLDWFDKAVKTFGKGDPIEAAPDFFTQTVEDTVSVPAPSPQEPAGACDEQQADPIKIADPDLASDFVMEAQEHFDSADEHLLILENDPENTQAIGAVFRSFHTLKGVAGFLGLTPVGDLAHAAETLLDEIRRGQRVFSGVTVELIFGALDMLKIMASDLQKALDSKADMPIRPELPGLIGKLRDLLEVDSSVGAPDSDPPPVAPIPEEAPQGAPMKTDSGDADANGAQEAGISGRASAAGGQTMKVEAARIDLLLDAIGELVIAESIVSGDPDILALRSQRLEQSLALLGKITRSLRDMGMSMRMVPVDPVFRKMARLVRDLARKSGKKVNLTIEGGDTEIDKGMVEKLGDPLVHMIRNSMDHGLESGAARTAAGKPEEGRIMLRAHHKGGNIHIDIEDDGAGLNRAAIAARAVEKGLIKSDEGMSDQDLFSLIFHAGFSTAARITEISGRGVGMDVVKRNIESLRGNVLIRSEPGKGSMFTLVLPLTTAIIDGMLAQVGKETYILPTLGILESFRPQAGQIHTVTGRGEMVSFRDALLPLYRLSRLLGVPEAEEDPLRAIVMVVEEYGKQWGLMVDDLLGQQQVVIKNLGEGMGLLAGLAGASILADGHPGLILDVGGIIKMAQAQHASDTNPA